MNPKTNHGLWVITMCQYRFILGKKYTFRVSDVDNREGFACLGEGIYGHALYLPVDFVVNFKLF